MLVVAFAGCGSEETQKPEAPTEIEVPEPEEELEENVIVHWSTDEWVINGISVFSGSESVDAIIGLLGAEEILDSVVPIGEIFYPSIFIDANSVPPHTGEAVFVPSHNMFWDIQTMRSGVTLMRGITIGETSIDEVLAMFPMNDERPDASVESGDGAYHWHALHDAENELAISFSTPGEGRLQYSIGFLDGVAHVVWFIQTRLPNEGASPGEPAPEFNDSAFPLDATEIILYQQGAAYNNTPFSVNDVEVTAQQFEAQMNQIYAGARYRLVSYRSLRSQDSFVFGASGATDTFMTRSQAIIRLGNETGQWASAYLAVLNGIATRPIAGSPEFGIGDFVEYGVDSVSIHDITGNSIPDLIFTSVARGDAMTVSFSVYSFDGSEARRIIHIDNLGSAGVSSPYYHAYFTNDGTLIINNNNTGFGRIHIFRNLDV